MAQSLKSDSPLDVNANARTLVTSSAWVNLPVTRFEGDHHRHSPGSVDIYTRKALKSKYIVIFCHDNLSHAKYYLIGNDYIAHFNIVEETALYCNFSICSSSTKSTGIISPEGVTPIKRWKDACNCCRVVLSSFVNLVALWRSRCNPWCT